MIFPFHFQERLQEVSCFVLAFDRPVPVLENEGAQAALDFRRGSMV